MATQGWWQSSASAPGVAGVLAASPSQRPRSHLKVKTHGQYGCPHNTRVAVQSHNHTPERYNGPKGYLPARQSTMSCCCEYVVLQHSGFVSFVQCLRVLSRLQATQSPSNQVWSPCVDLAPLWHVSSLALNVCASLQSTRRLPTCQHVGRPGLLAPTRRLSGVSARFLTQSVPLSPICHPYFPGQTVSPAADLVGGCLKGKMAEPPRCRCTTIKWCVHRQ